MASRSGSTTINIFINDGEDVLNMLGKGLKAVRETYPVVKNEFQVELADGLKFDENDDIIVDTTPTKSNQITVLTDVNIQIEKYSLTLTKTFADLVTHSTDAGVMVGITEENVRTESETIIIPDGYGYTSILSIPLREGTDERPNFYAK